MDVVTGKVGSKGQESEAKQFKALMAALGLDDKSINYDNLISNPQDFQVLKEQIVILIMQKDQDLKTMSQVDGMIKLIDKES